MPFDSLSVPEPPHGPSADAGVAGRTTAALEAMRNHTNQSDLRTRAPPFTFCPSFTRCDDTQIFGASEGGVKAQVI